MRAFVCLAAFLMACGGSGTRPVSFELREVSFDRFPATCGVRPGIPFTNDDLYSFELIGPGVSVPGWTSFEDSAVGLTFHSTDPLDVDLPVSLQPMTYGEARPNADGPTYPNLHQGGFAGNVAFDWQAGANPDAVDATPLTSATIRLSGFPSRDGEPMRATVRLTFEDGGQVALRAEAPLMTTLGGCPLP
jgi:hypothetical protein